MEQGNKESYLESVFRRAAEKANAADLDEPPLTPWPKDQEDNQEPEEK